MTRLFCGKILSDTYKNKYISIQCKCAYLKTFIIEFSFKGDILNKPSMILGHENLSKDRTSKKKKIRFHCHASSKRRQTHKMAHCELHCHFQKTNSCTCTPSLLHTFSTSRNCLFRHRTKFYRASLGGVVHLFLKTN